MREGGSENKNYLYHSELGNSWYQGYTRSSEVLTSEIDIVCSANGQLVAGDRRATNAVWGTT